MKLSQALSISDLRAIARRRLPRVVFDYVEGGAEDGVTLRANREAFERTRFAPRVLVNVSQRSQASVMFGHAFDSPLGIAPLGAAALCWHDADLAIARAARGANVPFALSTHSFVPVERIARESGAAPWFQLYMAKDRDVAGVQVQRALDAGCEVLVLTVDVPVGGNREYNERNGFGIPLRIGARLAMDGLSHPRWLTQVYLKSLRGRSIPEWSLRRDAADWDDLAWLRTVWPHKLLVKGVLTAQDARRAYEHGADGIVVSNHGGRQLDGASATLDVLPQISAAVGGRLAILADGGFRRGADVVKALALGADMALVGRPALYGVASGGEQGVRHALQILMSEIDRVLALLGVVSIDELGPEHLAGRPDDFRPRPPGADPV